MSLRVAVAKAIGQIDLARFVDVVPLDDGVPAAIGFGHHHTPAETVLRLAVAAEVSPGVRLLEIGTGSGYAAAVYAACGAQVTTIEYHSELVSLARRRLGTEAIHVVQADGLQGWEATAPYDVIMSSGSVQRVPPAWLRQLATGGRLLVPVGPPKARQELVLLERLAVGQVRRRSLGPARFTPLTIP